MIVNNAIYVDGKRVAKPATLAETTELNDSLKGMAWIGLFEPTEAEFQAVADEFDLHELAVEDAVQAHQRPKIERYGSILFVVLRTAHYVDPKEIIDFGEIHLFIGKDFVISVRHGDYPDLNQVRLRMENNPELLALGPPAVLVADEPTGQLDQATAAHVLDVLLTAADQLGAALVVSTHDPAVVQRLSTRWPMRDGSLAART